MNSSLRRGIRAKPRLYKYANAKRLQARLDSGSWVEKVAQRVADEVEFEDRKHHSHRRQEHDMRRVEQMTPGVVQPLSPTPHLRRPPHSPQTPLSPASPAAR